YSSWSFIGTIAKTLSSPGFTVEYKIGEAGTFGTWTGEPNLTVPANTAGTEVVYFRVNVNNGTSAGTHEENTAAKTITLTLSGVKDEGGNDVTEITNNNGDVITTSPVQTQHIQALSDNTNIDFNLYYFVEVQGIFHIDINAPCCTFEGSPGGFCHIRTYHNK